MEPWILTFSGRRVNPLDLRPEDISIEDIAHGLACINRFNGHAPLPVSVAQHSVGVSLACHELDARQGLLHDAAEAYLGDVTKWLKATSAFAAYREAEDRAQRTIYKVFGCPEEQADSVTEADRWMVRVEATAAWGELWQTGVNGYEAMDPKEVNLRIGPWPNVPWQVAKTMFLARFERV